MEKIFGWFYLSINLGAFISTLFTPWLLSNPKFGPAAFWDSRCVDGSRNRILLDGA